MPKAKMSDEQWIRFINECRSSGMSDKDWCIMHNLHPSTLYKAIRRLRKNACEIPAHEDTTISLKQEVVEVASIDEKGVITKTQPIEETPATNSHLSMHYCENYSDSVFEITARILTPSGIRVELSNSINAATLRTILGALQAV